MSIKLINEAANEIVMIQGKVKRPQLKARKGGQSRYLANTMQEPLLTLKQEKWKDHRDETWLSEGPVSVSRGAQFPVWKEKQFP